MEFSDLLKRYLNQAKCTAKDLSAVSGISPSALSRYRSGKRIPDPEQVEKLIRGLVQLAKKNAPELDEIAVQNDFSAYLAKPELDGENIVKNLNAAIKALDIRVSDLSKALRFDSSYLSRIRTCQRRPADPDKFVIETAGYIARTKTPAAIAGLIGCPVEELIPVSRCASTLCGWLSHGAIRRRDYLGELLHEMGTFNMDACLGRHFPETVPLREPADLSFPKYYYGFDEMKKGELDFFQAVSSEPEGTVFMCNSIPIENLITDTAYMREWMRSVAMMIMKGANIRIIHDVDRPSGEMLLGLMSWIPLYMTGKVTSYYLTDSFNRVYCHTDYVSDRTALSGECIRGYHDEGRYCLTRSETDLSYYKKRIQRLFSKARPLMKTYRAENREDFFRFEDSEVSFGGARRNILSSLPTYTIPDGVLENMLENNSLEEKDRVAVRNYIARQRKMAETVLESGTIRDEISLLSEEEFKKEPVYLSLSGMFSEKDLSYTYPDYQRHLAATKQYAADHAGYDLHTNAVPVFRNIQIQINAGKWVIISKNNAPAIHFVIKHPKMIRAFEDFCRPEAEP